MTTELWARVRGLFGKRGLTESQELEQIFAGWSAEGRTRSAGAAVERELFHPLKGWVRESPERDPHDRNPQRSVVRSAHDRTRAW
jgi:hypothetical protein